MIKINSLSNINPDEKLAILATIKQNNFAIYQAPVDNLSESKRFLKKLGAAFNLTQLDDNLCADADKITTLSVPKDTKTATNKQLYIPYSNLAIDWHTDGYYNSEQHTVQSFILHCVCPAKQGGDNQLINPDEIYQQIKQYNPDYIRILSSPAVMTIPANIVNGQIIRPAKSSAVFDTNEGYLKMRYTKRKHNIIWSDEAKPALRYLESLLDNGQFSQGIKLTAGQGVICNNVLHARSKFKDDNTNKRVMLRGRFYQRIVGC